MEHIRPAEYDDRFRRLQQLKKQGIDPYPASCKRDYSIGEFLASFETLHQEKRTVTLAGRIFAKRLHGKICFLDLRDASGKIQIIVQADASEAKKLQAFAEVGDFLSVTGKAGASQTKEKSLFAEKLTIAAKALRPIPKEFYRITDEETLVRQRYVETLLYPEKWQLFRMRSAIITKVRSLLDESGFIEVETPILQTHYGGALAHPFTTKLQALDLPLFLRIAPELYLKKMIVGGFEKIYEIGKNFRNEGLDREHNPEFTTLELYWAWQNREGLMSFTQKTIQKLVQSAKGIQPADADAQESVITYQKRNIDFSGTWPRLRFTEMLKEYAGLDYFADSLEAFIEKAKELEIQFQPKIITKGKLADELYKKLIRPNLINPTFIIDHPRDISPLAKAHPDNTQLTLRFQIVVGGTELANAWAELNDPVEEKQRFEEQARLLKEGEAEAHPYDETFIEALEYGMPPTAGLGIGLDRLVMLLTDQPSIKDVIYFPFVKPRQTG